MTGFYRTLGTASWGLGVISLILGLLLRLVSMWAGVNWRFTPRGALILAAVLFLCALATRGMERSGSS